MGRLLEPGAVLSDNDKILLAEFDPERVFEEGEERLR